MANAIYRPFIEKLGDVTATTYVGNKGDLFYDPDTTTLRISNGTTPGGSPVSGGSGDTGLVTFDNVSIIGAGTASGDGLGFGTLQLVPDASLTENDQYLIIDPTTPSHIHIRAGGQQDSSSAELYFGGEKHHVRVIDNTGVRLQNYRDVENNYYYTAGFTGASWYTMGGDHFVEFTTTDADIINYFFQIGNNIDNRLSVYYSPDSSFALQQNGSASNPEGDLYRIQVNAAPPTSPTTVTALNFQIFTVRENEVILENNDFTVRATDDIRIYASDVFALYNYAPDEPISIYTDYDNNSYQWQFREDGNLSLPGNLIFDDNSVQTSAALSLANLKLIVAESTSFEDFQSRIAGL